MQVVDPHVHFWDLRTHRYPWLENPRTSFVGDATLLRHDYLPDDLRWPIRHIRSAVVCLCANRCGRERGRAHGAFRRNAERIYRI